MRHFTACGYFAGSEKTKGSSELEDLSRHFRRSASISPARERNAKLPNPVSKVRLDQVTLRPYQQSSDIELFWIFGEGI